jgi:putative DNA methylase
MSEFRRLIEDSFPLRPASVDSLHEKNMRHGHISTLHIWPARRPLAASRASIIATLVPTSPDPEQRRALEKRMAGEIIEREERKKLGGKTISVRKKETVGGILHWGRESDTDLEWFRTQIRDAFGGRAPRVLDPFAGGGAIPLEAMRLGCETTAIDVNPVAWLILKCTLEFPQRLAGELRALPAFAGADEAFLSEFFKARGVTGVSLRSQLARLGFERSDELDLVGLEPTSVTLEAPLAWHVRAWGKWVANKARIEIGALYPECGGRQPLAYLWARTITCSQCRASIPLIKTRWLCRKEKKRVLLTYGPNAAGNGVDFGLEQNAKLVGGNAAQRREHDRRLAEGTVSRSGAKCPCCGKFTTLEDYQFQAQAGGMGAVLLAVVEEAPIVLKAGKAPGKRKPGKAYRLPVAADYEALTGISQILAELEESLPCGLPNEPISGERPSPNARGMSGLTRFGITTHRGLYSARQLAALGTFVKLTRDAVAEAKRVGYTDVWCDALRGYLYCALARLADRLSTLCTWQPGAQQVNHVFARYALTMTTDYAETAPLADSSGGFLQAVEWIGEVVEHVTAAASGSIPPNVVHGSAGTYSNGKFDLILTDPPYYDAVPYSDVMDFFYVWARRVVGDIYPEQFKEPLAPREEEYIQHAGRLGGDNARAKALYESNMERAFHRTAEMLGQDGRFVVVFAHKDPNAWGTLVGAIVRAGFTVDASWPIQTERASRLLALSSAALSSSVWLVCKKRPDTARPGWDNQVLEEMRTNINIRLREYWDAGIRGPDFVWAATGPALEAYSRHPVVKKANAAGETMKVDEFLRAVRRIVVDFVVGRVLSHGTPTEVTGLDDLTTYYLLHRHDFGLKDAPIGPCILYAVSCGLSDAELEARDLVVRSGGAASATDDNTGEEEDDEESGDTDEGDGASGTMIKLRAWHQRGRPGLGYDPGVDSGRAKRARVQPALAPEFEAQLPSGRSPALIDQVHRLMQLWKAGDQAAVDEYLDQRALWKNVVFHHLLQALIELSDRTSDERSILESLSNHVGRISLMGIQVEAEV